MVLRPNVLRYKGRVRKIDSAKMEGISKRMQAAEKELNQKRLIPKTSFFIGFLGFAVFATPLIYVTISSSNQQEQLARISEHDKESEQLESELLFQEHARQEQKEDPPHQTD